MSSESAVATHDCRCICTPSAAHHAVVHTLRCAHRELRPAVGGSQVHVTSLTHTVQGNYDVQFVLDPHAVVEYIVKYKTKPEKRSETYKDMMKELVKTTDVSTQSMAGMCASLMNVLSGNRDFGDVETCHQLNQLELMK